MNQPSYFISFLLRLSLPSSSFLFPFFLTFYLQISISVSTGACTCLCLFETEENMNHCGIQQSGNFSQVVCPKPRRINLYNTMNEPVRSFRWQMCHQQDNFDTKSGPELVDLILAKGAGYGDSDQTCTQIASSPPFFCGSPPSRVSNPLIQDARFGEEKFSPFSPLSMIPNPSSGMPSSSPSSSARKGGCARPNYGNKPAVRIEGFDCLDMDNRRNCSIPALA